MGRVPRVGVVVRGDLTDYFEVLWTMAPMSFPVPVLFLIALFWAIPTVAQQTGSASPPGSTSRGAAEHAMVKPGDRIALKIWMEPEMSDTFVVALSGDVILPKLGAVRASNHTVVALQDSLRRAYSAFLRNPSLEVTVLRRIGVHGEVHRPGLYLVDLTMTLRDIIAQAGGITPGGDANKISVIRDGERIQFSRGRGSEFVAAELVSGDQVAVGPRSWFERNSLAVVSTGAVVFSILIPVIRDLLN